MQTQPFLFLYVNLYSNQHHRVMNAVTLISTLMFTRAGETKLETATNVLTELKTIKSKKQLPFLTIRRAIKMQEKIIRDL